MAFAVARQQDQAEAKILEWRRFAPRAPESLPATWSRRGSRWRPAARAPASFA